jgi:hypothetical protein
MSNGKSAFHEIYVTEKNLISVYSHHAIESPHPFDGISTIGLTPPGRRPYDTLSSVPQPIPSTPEVGVQNPG